MADQGTLPLGETIEPTEPDPKTVPTAEPDAEQAGGLTPEAQEPSVPSPPSADLEERLAQAESERQSEREQRIRLEERAKAAETKPPARPVFTADQLQEKVDDGTITQARATQIIVDQAQTQTLERMGQSLDERDNRTQRTNRVQSQLDAYKERVPDIMRDGSDARRRIQEEYRTLVSMGLPEGQQTEVAACRSVYGPPTKIRDLTRTRRPTHEETAGSGAAGGGARNVDIANKIPSRYRDYYRQQVENGHFTGWDDPRIEKDLKYMKPDARAH